MKDKEWIITERRRGRGEIKNKKKEILSDMDVTCKEMLINA